MTASAWPATDAAGALKFAEKLPPGGNRDLVLRHVVGNWANVDPAAALAYANKLPAGAAKLLARRMGF